MSFRAALILSLLALPVLAEDAVAPMRQVLVLTTGGTIASRRDAPLIEGSALVNAVPELRQHATIEVEEFSVIGSSQMTPAHWLRLAKTINERFEDNADLAGIVVTHGTDTLEETAYFLNLTVQWQRPVVLTGSMRSSDEISADGTANLINAVRVAVSDEAAGQGVLVALNESISAARDVWKTDNRRVQTFEGSDGGHVGVVDPDGVRFYRRSLLPHTTSSEFDVSDVDALPKVLILSDFTGMNAGLVERFRAEPADGLVIRTFAGGRMSPGMLEGLTETAGRNDPVVVTSRVPKGRIVSPPSYPFPAVVSSGQQDNKARILLMLALTRTSDLLQIQRIFDTY